CSRALFGDDRLLKNPQLLEDPINACLSAGWYWNSRKLNAYADADRFTAISGLVNTGSDKSKPTQINGYQDRRAWWDKARKVLGVKIG
ncbi:MAG TPA: hypothetical protein VNJ47_10530, partial [Nevskiales bacterium]|nr:hypothetical protein [Nevskiales bacterium]